MCKNDFSNLMLLPTGFFLLNVRNVYNLQSYAFRQGVYLIQILTIIIYSVIIADFATQCYSIILNFSSLDFFILHFKLYFKLHVTVLCSRPMLYNNTLAHPMLCYTSCTTLNNVFATLYSVLHLYMFFYTSSMLFCTYLYAIPSLSNTAYFIFSFSQVC